MKSDILDHDSGDTATTAEPDAACSKKRGRPRAFDEQWFRRFAALHPHIKSERQLRTRAWAFRGVQALSTTWQPLAVIDGVERLVDLTTDYLWTAALVEVGRLADALSDGDAQFFAKELCRRIPLEGPTRAECVAWLKLMRREMLRAQAEEVR